jgi:hypothetical protein
MVSRRCGKSNRYFYTCVFKKLETGITDINISRLEQISALFNCKALSYFINYKWSEQEIKTLLDLETLTKKLHMKKDVEVIGPV